MGTPDRVRTGMTALLAAWGVAASFVPGGTASAEGASFSPDRVLVRFEPGAAALDRAAARAAAGADVDVVYTVVPGLERLALRPGRTVEETVAALRRNPNVRYAEPDYVLRAGAVPNDPYYGSLWGMANSRAPQAWDVATGSGSVVVAIIDTGMDRSHPDLQGNLWTNPGEVAANGLDDDGNGYVDDVYGWDFAYGDNNPSDVHGHGTHTAGTVGARGNNATGVVGVSWQVKLVALKFLDNTGYGLTSNAVSAVQYAVNEGIRLSNNSWGGDGFSQALYDAIKASQSIGHLFVASAGNDSSNNDAIPVYPASYALDNVVAVASITSADGLSSFSNYGASSVDLGAPGSSILSAVPGGYGYASGTSMAAPHVTGAAALVLGLHPGWTYQQVRAAILDTARPIAALAGRTVTGGTLDLYAAVTASGGVPAITLSPTSLAFGDQPVGTSSTARLVTLTNSGTAALPIVSIGLSGTGASHFGSTQDCGTSVPVGASCTIRVTFAPLSGGSKAATLSVAGGSGAGTKTVSLSGRGIVPTYSLTPTALAFGDVVAGSVSASQLVTLTNTGTLPLPITSISLTGSYASQYSMTHTCGASVAVGAGCTISVAFRPSSGGSKTAYVTVSGGGGAATSKVKLSGTGVVPTYSLVPTSLAFGEQIVGHTSPAQVVTLSNTGTLALPVTSIRLSSSTHFGMTHTCGAMVDVGTSCTISVVFKPTSAGSKTATLSVAGGGGAGTKSVALGGTGVVPLYTLTPASLAFGEQPVGTTSPAQLVTLANTGTLPLPITSITLSGSSFSMTHTCGTSVAVGASCTISVAFKPTSGGAKTGTVTMSGGDGAGSKKVTLSGTGLVPLYTLTPASLAFGEQAAGTTSGAQVVTLTNTGTLVLPISSIRLSGTDASQFGMTHTCGTSVAVGATCGISVAFKPTTAGAKAAAVTVSGGGGAGTKTAPLSGTGL